VEPALGSSLYGLLPVRLFFLDGDRSKHYDLVSNAIHLILFKAGLSDPERILYI
jgi:hypothetical protein